VQVRGLWHCLWRNQPSWRKHESEDAHLRKIVVITDADAGVARAAATEFARNGCDVALLSCEIKVVRD